MECKKKALILAGIVLLLGSGKGILAMETKKSEALLRQHAHDAPTIGYLRDIANEYLANLKRINVVPAERKRRLAFIKGIYNANWRRIQLIEMTKKVMNKALNITELDLLHEKAYIKVIELNIKEEEKKDTLALMQNIYAGNWKRIKQAIQRSPYVLEDPARQHRQKKGAHQRGAKKNW